MGINQFIKTFNEIFKTSFKKVKKKINIKKEGKLKWVTKGIRTSSKMKRFLNTLKFKHNNTLANYRNKYITVFRRVIRGAKRLSVSREIETAKNSSKAIWKIVNKYRNCKKKTQSKKKLH